MLITLNPSWSYDECGITNPTIADYPAPRPQDFPFLDVDGRIFNLTAGAATCNIGVTFSDGAPIQTCPFTYKFVRTYTVIDWCVPADQRTFTQIVKVGDTHSSPDQRADAGPELRRYPRRRSAALPH